MEKWDSELYAELLTLPKFPFLRLVRQNRRALAAARRQFFADGTLPEFTYLLANTFDAAGYLELLVDVEARLANISAAPELRELYVRKCQELRTRAECIIAIQCGDDRHVTRLAKKLFGTPSASLAALRQELAERQAQTGHVHRSRVDAEQFAAMARRVLDYYGLHDWRLAILARHSVQIGHGKRGRTPLLRIPRKLLISKQRAIRLLTHEIEVHALRTANGAASPLHILERGCAGYIAADEGLAMMASSDYSINGGELHSEKKSRGGFWEAYAAALTMQYGFRETFDELAAASTPAKAWRLCVRAYRGIRRPHAPGLGFLRDHVYRSGQLAVTAAINRDPTLLPLLFSGNCSLADIPALRALKIPTGKLPDMVSQRIVNEELRK